MNERRLGIFGGSFSPPHLGHLHAAQIFLSKVKLDKLYIIPSFLSPGKSPDRFASPLQRMEMCRLTFFGLTDTEISDMEIRRGGDSFTKDTLNALSAPDTRLFVLCGTDTALSLDLWCCPEELFSLAEFVCVRRENDVKTVDELEKKNQFYQAKYHAQVRILTSDVKEASSSEIREVLLSGGQTSLVLPKVADYIERNGLYRNDR